MLIELKVPGADHVHIPAGVTQVTRHAAEAAVVDLVRDHIIFSSRLKKAFFEPNQPRKLNINSII